MMRGVMGWSAEFRINEDLLEGWNHRASIMFVHDASLLTDDDSNWPEEAVVSSPLMWAQAQFGEMSESPPNRAPVADAGPDQVVGSLNPITVYLDGRASYDPDSNLLGYQWDQTEGQLIKLINTQQSVAQVLILPLTETIEYTFELTVNDGELTSIPSQVSVIIYPGSGHIPQSPGSGGIFPPFVTVANPGNATDDSSGFGAVGAIFEIGTTEVTNVLYVMFLNAVAKADPNGLFDERMESDPRGGIIQTGISGSYFYESKPYMSTKPVNYVSWLDAVRFVNWLENDMSEGVQDSLTTEAGAYDLSVFQPGVNAVRNSESQYGLANENQWYKAAFYNPETQQYRSYPLQNEEGPQRAAATGTGNVRNPGDNVINFNNGATWFGMNGNVTSVVSAMASSEYGTYDQGGNVAEWLDGISERDFRITRGGFYGSGAEMVSSFGRSLRSFDYAGNDVGFRIVVKGSCLGDFNGDGDVDGSDLAHQSGQDTSISVSDFAANYGLTDCI
ncbi:MAG: hypothetical protein E4H46_01555 [Desulfobacterales bacterium]|nr:MAG: hypothetical protein E4H46_01555 [Desulfobacterales bacterium]